ncbi:uncharacterized protein LOC128887706 [Hylaeus anthracinus]|uniref:uncharacterized protein LOC128887706 n=1 Tax=Hylaeus anthracinus TaxID=313031 RepID=UPI0023BA0B6E|nr:uncharacterized protein LOC128887706 [Hylaeus anthracinus]
MAAMCIAATCSTRESQVHPINMERNKFGEFQNLMLQLIEDEERFKTYYRMTKREFYHVLSLVGTKIEKQCTQFEKSIPAEIRLAVYLRYSTIGEIVKECCEAIWEILQPIYIPESKGDQWREIANDFHKKWKYPSCIGALDGKHIQIKCPANTGSLFYNYNGTYSIVLLALVDANYKFILVRVGAFGKSSDEDTFKRSNMGQLPYVIVADEAFPLKPYLMRPYSRTAIISDHEKMYNYRHSRARRIVENAFGILAGRWRVFLTTIQTNPETVDKIVLAATCLHNMLRNNTNSISSSFEEHFRIDNTQIQGIANLEPIRRNCVREAVAIRDSYKNYFISRDGSASCPWQWDSIRRGRV